MDLRIPLSGRYPRYHAELRLFITSTSHDIGPERSSLLNMVLPELRRRAGERGVIVVECDPRLEVSLSPGRADEILATRMNELHGHRPLFIGILGSGAETRPTGEHAHLPWLNDMGAGKDRLIAIEFIERVLDSQLMQGRAFFYVPDSSGDEQGGGMDGSGIAQRLMGLRARARDGHFPIREGIPDIDALARSILEDLLAALDQLHPSGGALSPLEEIRRPHTLFAARLRRAYHEIPSYFDRLDDHVAGTGAPLLITGRSGGGKSALIANWMEYRQNTHPGIPVICHYVEAASAGSDHGAVLRHLMAELKTHCGITAPLPDTAGELAEAFPRWLEQVGHERLVLAIDGADQLEAASRGLDWLPANASIPPNVRLVVSVAHEEEAGEEIALRLAERGWPELRVEPLTTRQRQAIISRLVEETGVENGPDFLARLALGDDISSPLFIRMGAVQIVNTTSEKDRNALLSARTGEEFLALMFDQLEQRFGARLIGDVMPLIWGARAGLLEEELLQLTKADPALLANFLTSADHYLVEQDRLWTFMHKQIRDAVERRYLPESGMRKSVHRRLARYFASGPVTRRRADEEPWQWERAGNRGELANSLADIGMFIHLSEEGRRHELRGYWVRLNDEGLLVETYARSFAAWTIPERSAEERAAVAERLGEFFTTSGLLPVAEGYLRLALELFRQRHGEGHIDIAHAMHSLAELLRQRGEFTEAGGLYREALAILEEKLSPDDPAIAQVLSDTGLLYRDSGQHHSALAYYQRALDLKERIHGTDHPATAEILNDLALFYQDRHEFSQAIPLYERALEIRERHLGAAHPAVATTLNNLGGALRDSGDLDAAEAHYRRALDIRERMLGPNHPNTLMTVGNLASFFRLRKNFAEAGAMSKRAVTASVEELGEENPITIGLKISHAGLLSESGENEAAEILFREVLEVALGALGRGHPYVGACFHNLASLLRKMNREEETAPLYEGAIEAWKTSWGADHPHVASALHNLGVVRIGQKDLDRARAHLAEALAIREKHFGSDHEATAQTRARLEEANASTA